MYCIRHIQNSGIFTTLFIQLYSGIFKHIQHYWDIFRRIEALLRHTETYSGIFRTLCNICIFTILPYFEPRNIRTGGKFKTLWNFEQGYSEPYHSQDSLFNHIDVYSEPSVTFSYAEAWHIRNPEIFRTLPQLHPDAY